MNSSDSSSDLHHLTRDRSTKPAMAWKSLLPAVLIVGGILAMLASVFGDRLRPAIPVQTAQVLLLPANHEPVSPPGRSSGKVLFQASGWIEADPWPVRVPVLADGFIQAIFVQEGQRVTNGQVLVTLDDQDARLDLEQRALEATRLEIELTAHLTGLHAAEAEIEAAMARQDMVAARFQQAEDQWTRIKHLEPGHVSEAARVAARSAYEETESEKRLAEIEFRQKAILLGQLHAQHAVKSQQILEKHNEIEQAQLRLERMVLRSPMDGVIQRRLVEPGAKRMAGMDDPDSATVVTLFDPRKLQVRVDVPLAEAGLLEIGQSVKISTAMLPGRVFTGAVTRIAGEADLQRNTLQVKVNIANPDDRLRPEVLCRVEFSETTGKGRANDSRSEEAGGLALWVPLAAVSEQGAGHSVWVVDLTSSTVSEVAVEWGTEKRDGYRRARSGVAANQTLVVHSDKPLYPGARVRPSTAPQNLEDHP